MKVKPIAITKSLIVHEGRELTADELIVYCARVSNPENQLNVETAPRLLAYCIRNRHWSVFEQADLTVEIETSRAIAAQILRHKSFSFQEYSQRYSAATASEPIELRLQGEKNRQGGETVVNNGWLTNLASATVENAFNTYSHLVNNGVSKETARFVLPLSTSTRLYMKGNIRSWIHYLEVRTNKHAQKEHRLVAEEISKIMEELFPSVMAALKVKE